MAPVFFAACSGSDDNKVTDMAVKVSDASVDASDIPHGDKACSTILFTAQSCSGDNVPACVKAAIESGTVMAQSEFQALLVCGYTNCVGKTFDGGAGDGGITGCTSANDTTSGCQQCVSREATGSACKSEFSACVNGT